jgi:hypothetical protein
MYLKSSLYLQNIELKHFEFGILFVKQIKSELKIPGVFTHIRYYFL